MSGWQAGSPLLRNPPRNIKLCPSYSIPSQCCQLPVQFKTESEACFPLEPDLWTSAWITILVQHTGGPRYTTIMGPSHYGCMLWWLWNGLVIILTQFCIIFFVKVIMWLLKANAAVIKWTNGLLWMQFCWKPEMQIFGKMLSRDSGMLQTVANVALFAEHLKFNQVIAEGTWPQKLQIWVASLLFQVSHNLEWLSDWRLGVLELLLLHGVMTSSAGLPPLSLGDKDHITHWVVMTRSGVLTGYSC